MSSKDVENRLVRMETRMVKYQENNIQQLMGIHDALDKLCEILDLLNDTEEKDDEQSV